MTLRLNVFGGLSATRDGAPQAGPASQRRSLALLAVLAVHGPAGVSREKLGALLWPESDEANARNSLKQVVYVVRRALGPDVVLGSTVLRLGVDVIASDLAEFELALARDDREKAIEAYAGPFLDGFHLAGDAEEFERWADTQRARLARGFGEALEALATRAVSNGDHRTALRWWHRLADAAPLDSRFAHEIVGSLLAIGDRAGALHYAEAHRSLLSAELGLPLGADLEGLVAAARIAPIPEAVQAPPLPTRAPANAPAQLPLRPPAWRRTALLTAALLIVTAAAVFGRTPSPRAPPVDSHRVALIATVHNGDDASTSAKARLLLETISRRLVSAALVRPVVLSSTAGADARDAAVRVGARYVISVAAIAGPDGFTEASLTDATSGERLWGSRVTAGSQARADALAERTAAAVAVRLDPNMANWIGASSGPSSYEAYQEFARGLALFAAAQFPDAEPRFRAAARDSGFTMALVLAGWSSYYAGRKQVADSIARALQPRRLLPLERAMVDLQLAIFARDLDAQYHAGLAVAAAAPGSEWRYLLSDAAIAMGRGREAVRVLEEIGPDRGWMRGSFWFWIHLDRGLHYLGQYDRELSAMTEARRRFPGNRIIAQGYIKALSALGRVDEVEAEVGRALTLRHQGTWGYAQPMNQAVAELAAHGYREGARRIAALTLAWLRRQPADEQKGWAAITPLFLYAAGEVDAARTGLERLVANDPSDSEDLALLAEICVEQGDRAVARGIDARLAAVADPSLRVDMLVDRASVAASLGNRERAVGFLRDAYREGFDWRTVLHIQPGFARLKGYPPYEGLIRPVE